MLLTEHLVRCETGSVDISTPWYKNGIERLQQIFLMVKAQNTLTHIIKNFDFLYSSGKGQAITFFVVLRLLRQTQISHTLLGSMGLMASIKLLGKSEKYK